MAPRREARVTALALPPLISALLAALFPFVAHEAVFVSGRGMTSLAHFDCRRVTSSLIDTVCYDSDRRELLVQVRGAYHGYCAVAPEEAAALLRAPSVGRHYRRVIDGRYRCGAEDERGSDVRP